MLFADMSQHRIPVVGSPLRRAPGIAALITLGTLTLGVVPSRAAPVVTGLSALHHDGQTFLTWNTPAPTGWRYRAYASTAPITSGFGLASAALVGSVLDSTWCDRRLSAIRGVTYGHAIDSLAPPLTVANGLLVATAASSGARYYAVTAQPIAGVEDTAVALGQNSLVAPVAETLSIPRPVYQRTLSQGAFNPTVYDVYTIWTSPTDTPLYPAMGTVHGLAFDCAIVRGGTRGGLMVRPHARGGNFLNGLSSSGEPGEWRLCLDDHLFTSTDRNSFWYGYHAGYDPFVAVHTAPASGLVVDYTLRRIVHTLAWARRTFPVDTTRVYAIGGSMGGIGSLMLAYRVPRWIAAIQAVIPKFDFSFTSDPNPGNAWNAGSPERAVGDHLWGTVAANLPTTDGLPVYDRLDDGVLAERDAGVSLPVMFAFNGKIDTVVGWAEKIPYYAAIQTHRHGGAYYFDGRNHSGSIAGAWTPMQNARDLYRFRTDRSYPALARGSADDDPGNGAATDGDSIGTLNGFAEWDTTLTDMPSKWECTLRLRNLTSLWGAAIAPESIAVDVTPRRLQRFNVTPGAPFAWRATRVIDGVIAQSGIVLADSLGLVTVTALRVPRSGVVLTLEPAGAVAVAMLPVSPAGIALRLGAQPLRGSADLEIAWPATGPADVALYDVAGRHLRTVFAGEARQDRHRVVIEANDLPAGVVFLVARQGPLRATARVIVLN